MIINLMFPLLLPSYTVDIVDCYNNIQKGCKVLRNWYPKEGDTWNETDEYKQLGYCCSSRDKWFPQVLVQTHAKYGLYILTGDDAEKILNIYYNGKLIRRKPYYKLIKSK
jgi:hypothetical protein